MIKRRAAAADLPPSTCCHTFRATGITASLSNGGTLEHAQQIAGHASPKTTKLYDRTADTITVAEIDLPKYLTASRWARCAAIKGGSKVEVPTVRWHWNAHERVAVAPGIACFSAGNEYAHGGLSLQESLVPVIRVTAGKAAAKATTEVAEVNWAGLRCRVRVEAAQPSLSVDLRTKVNDAGSSVSQARVLDAKGAASLLIVDDELEGTPAVVVVLDASGHVIAKQPTIIGGDD